MYVHVTFEYTDGCTSKWIEIFPVTTVVIDVDGNLMLARFVRFVRIAHHESGFRR